jgi:hypothetical protein
VKEVWFTDRFPKRAFHCHYIDLRAELTAPPSAFASLARRIELQPVFARHEAAWKRSFIEQCGALNIRNAGLSWWAYGTSSKKSFLVPQLGNRFLEVLALCNVLESVDFTRLLVVGATPAQVRAVRGWLSHEGRARSIRLVDRLRAWRERAQAWSIPLRVVWQALRVLAILARRLRRPFSGPLDLCLFTFVDGNFRGDSDPFFGALGDRLSRAHPQARIVHVAYLQGPQGKLLRQVESAKGNRYWPLFGELKLGDLLWALNRTFGALLSLGHTVRGIDAGPQLKSLLGASLRWDLGQGAYLYHLLTYRAVRRLAAGAAPARLVYPYENKALERMLISGVREGHRECELVGYQHTSITPRHTTLLFVPGEARVTPLPDRIWTVGDVTRSFLENHGNYPAGLLETACALRQNTSPPAGAPGRMPGKLRILLALSSSRFELLRAAGFFRLLDSGTPNFELAIRPHPEFPLSLLPDELRAWVRAVARDLTGTALDANLDWCDLTAYVSSTVALETLLAGKPVVNISIGDPITPDPLLGDPPFRWHASDPAEFERVLAQITSLAEGDFDARRRDAKAYAMRYLQAFTPGCAEKFLAPSGKCR